MAVLNQDDNLTQTPQQQAAGGGNTVGGTGGFIGGGSSGQGATTKVAAPTSSGSYTNLQSYIGANQGADTTMGNAVAGTVGTAGKAADKAIGDWGAAGAANATAGTPALDQGFMDKVKAGTSGSAPYAGPTSAPVQTYSGKTDPTQVDGAQAANTAYQNLNGLVTQADPNAKTGGAAGLGELLKKTYDQPAYTAGENTLDTAITGGGAGGQAALKGIKDAWGGEGQKLADTGATIGADQMTGQNLVNAHNALYSGAVTQGQNAPWTPAFDTGSVGVMGTTAELVGHPKGTTVTGAPGAGPAGLSGVSSGTSGNGTSGTGQAVNALKPTMPGPLNHAVAGSGAGGAGTPINLHIGTSGWSGPAMQTMTGPTGQGTGAQALGAGTPVNVATGAAPAYNGIKNVINQTLPTPDNIKGVNTYVGKKTGFL